MASEGIVLGRNLIMVAGSQRAGVAVPGRRVAQCLLACIWTHGADCRAVIGCAARDGRVQVEAEGCLNGRTRGWPVVVDCRHKILRKVGGSRAGLRTGGGGHSMSKVRDKRRAWWRLAAAAQAASLRWCRRTVAAARAVAICKRQARERKGAGGHGLRLS